MHKADAERVLAVLGKRLGKFGLQLHPDKTRLVDFRPQRSTDEQGSTLPTTFNFLGFTHVWGKSRKGNSTVRQLTAKDRLARSLKAINQRCKRMRHWPVRAQYQRLCQVMMGHYAYFGITGNIHRLRQLYQRVRGSGRSGCRAGRRRAMCCGHGFSGCLSILPCRRPGSCTLTSPAERSCATKNRMRELRSCGSVRGGGSDAPAYSEASANQGDFYQFIDQWLMREMWWLHGPPILYKYQQVNSAESWRFLRSAAITWSKVRSIDRSLEAHQINDLR